MEAEPGVWAHRSAIKDLTTLRIFVAVVEAGSFTEAGRRLRIVPSTVSKHVSSLEASLKGQLIARSTQRLSITELGRQFYERCLVILHEVEDAENEIIEYQAEPQGQLRVSAAPVLAVRHLMPILSDFLSEYPRVKLDLTVTPEPEDLIASGIDAAIRISRNVDPNLIAVKLGANERVYCAAPGYLARRGTPNSVADLKDHNCLVIQNVAQSANWPMKTAGGSIDTISVAGNFVSNNADMIRQALLADMGIGHLARFMVDEHIASGALVELFPHERMIFSNIFVVFPKRRNLPLKTRAFVDYLRVAFGKIAWTDQSS